MTTGIDANGNLIISPEHFQTIFKQIEQNPGAIFRLPEACVSLARLRMQQMGDVKIRVYEKAAEDVHQFGIEHNIDQLMNLTALDRPLQLLTPLLSIDYIRRHQSSIDLLSIGPRSEAELFALYGMGFNPKHVKALDLISYSDLVTLGDAHDMPFAADSFDVIVLGWVFAYSANNQKIADEVMRIAKPGAHIAIGCVCEPPARYPEEALKAKTQVGGVHTTWKDQRFGERVLSLFFNCGQILRMFENRIDTVVFQTEPHPKLAENRSNLLVILRLK